MTSPILFDTKRHANRAHAVHRVIVLHHELPNFLGKPIVTVLRQDQFLLSKFVPVHSDDIAKMIEKIIDRLAELQSRPRTIPVLGHVLSGLRRCGTTFRGHKPAGGEELPAEPTRRHILCVRVCSPMRLWVRRECRLASRPPSRNERVGMFVFRASGSLAISEALRAGTHGFASHGYPWFAFVSGTRRFVGYRRTSVTS